jgi:hypothetical protein
LKISAFTSARTAPFSTMTSILGYPAAYMSSLIRLQTSGLLTIPEGTINCSGFVYSERESSKHVMALGMSQCL